MIFLSILPPSPDSMLNVEVLALEVHCFGLSPIHSEICEGPRFGFWFASKKCAITSADRFSVGAEWERVVAAAVPALTHALQPERRRKPCGARAVCCHVITMAVRS